jgi:plastocyanin
MLNRLIIFLSLTTFAFSIDLFFSEYAEGSSNNKYLEIYNPTDATIELSGYAFPSVSNAPDEPGMHEYWNTFDEGAIIAAGDVYVICHGSSDDFIQAECDQFHTYLSNGDDGYCLALGTEDQYQCVDWVGDFNGDPGSAWDVCGIGDTKDNTLVRKSSVVSGNDWTTSSNADTCEWDVYDNNTWDFLGYHNYDGATSNEVIVEAGMFYYAPTVLTIDVGDTVTWDNVMGFHDVVAYDGSFSLPACSAPCVIGSVTFDEPGVYEYYCSVGTHEAQGMVGTIVVEGDVQLPCEDETACNFLAYEDCTYPAEGECDCDGNILDCAGECGGDAVVDSCGECGGSDNCTVQVVFQLDMSVEGVVEGNDIRMRIATIDGEYNPSEWYSMVDDDGDLTYKWDLQLAPGVTYGYNFNDSNGSGYESGDNLDGICAAGIYGNDRILVGPAEDTTLDVVCWESCDACPDQIFGCTDDTALNYDSTATDDDGSCIYEWPEIDNLFFSEYAEGSSNNKYLEIYNATDGDVDLSGYSLSSCSNGCDEVGAWDYPDNVTFSATVASGDVYVVCHQSADEIILAECDQTFTYLSNGDDVFALTQVGSGLVLDVIGLVGEDPGSGWDVAGVSNATKDHTLVRKSDVTSGNPLWLDNPDTGEQGSAGDDADDSEWIVFDQNTWVYLGYHEMEDNGAPDCVLDCPSFELIDGTCDEFGGDDESDECMITACTIITQWTDCWADCGADELCDFPISLLAPACEYCLIDGSCNDGLENAVCEVDGYEEWTNDCTDGEDVFECGGSDECGISGDINGDDTVNVLDVVTVVNGIINATDVACSDLNGDGTTNILDIVIIVGIITNGRADDATEATFYLYENKIEFESDGYVGAVQMTLTHNNDFSIELTNAAFVADYATNDNQTILIVVNPESPELFTSSGNFEIEEILAANSNDFINVIIEDGILDVGNLGITEFNLGKVYPNPFNPNTTFEISVPTVGHLSVKIYDLSGKLVDVIADDIYNQNSYTFTWNASAMPSGVYVINAEFDNKSISQNISLIK